MRPDHGLKTKEDLSIKAHPGYPYYGRKRGLEELVELEKSLQIDGA
jgi:D-mannonate dehydratase